jgi:uncharacterized membrane protein YccF (DUF307 family)
MLGMIRLILNILWLIFGSGIAFAIAYAIAGIICFLLVVTIPFGVAAFRLANYSLWPFGRTLAEERGAGGGVPSTIANVLWVLLAGWWLALLHILAGIAQFVTIIGIPFGIANFKLVPAAFWPLGRRIVPIP